MVKAETDFAIIVSSFPSHQVVLFDSFFLHPFLPRYLRKYTLFCPHL